MRESYSLAAKADLSIICCVRYVATIGLSFLRMDSTRRLGGTTAFWVEVSLGLQCTRFRSSSAACIRGDTTSSSLSGPHEDGPAADSAGASWAASCMNGLVERASCCCCDDARGPNDVRRP